MDTFATVMALLEKGVKAAGGILAAWGGVTVGRSLKDSNGPGMQMGIMEIVGGAIIFAAGAIIGAVTM